MPIAEDVAKIYETPQIQRVRFKYAVYWFTPDLYKRIAHAVRFAQHRVGGIRVRVNSTMKTLLAAYDPKEDRIDIRDAFVPYNAFGKAALVHEGMHAIVDMRYRAMRGIAEEALGFVAEAIYLRALNVKAPSSPMHKAADAVVVSKNLHQSTNRSEELYDGDLKALMTAVSHDPAYPARGTRLSFANGIIEPWDPKVPRWAK